MVFDAFEVAAVARLERVAGHAGGLHAVVYHVVGGVAVGEAVGHEHVHEIGLGEALHPAGGRAAGA